MSPDHELLNLAGAESESKTLFDELAGLVPAERQAEYYRVIAHTRTLSPNDEMLRILEAMGILALLTRETPAAIAAERKSLQKILENALSTAGEVEKRMAAYTSRLESSACLRQNIRGGQPITPETTKRYAARLCADIVFL